MADGPDNDDRLITSIEGSAAAREQLIRQVLPVLHERAAAAIAREAPGHTLQPTAVVHEVYLRMVDQTRVDWRGQTHFLAVAAEAMRRVLVDHARRRKAMKRGGGWERVPWVDAVADRPARDVELLDLDEALTALAALDRRAAQIVELRYFGQLSDAQIAIELGIAERTVRSEWAHARAWLNARLQINE